MGYFLGQPVSGWLVTEYLSKEEIFGQENRYCLCQKIQTAFSPFINHAFILWNNFLKRAVGTYYSLKDQTNPPNPKSKQTKPQTYNVWMVHSKPFISVCRALSILVPASLASLIIYLFPRCNFHVTHIDLFLDYEHVLFLLQALLLSCFWECLSFYFSKYHF